VFAVNQCICIHTLPLIIYLSRRFWSHRTR
jgi:hypothetical protein